MFATEFADLTTGYERFDALKKNLEGIFDKIHQMKEYQLDISYYEKKFEEFKKEFKLADDFLQSSKMPFEGMQKDYEAFTLGECNKKLEKLTMEFEENVTPIYNIYLLLTTIDLKLFDQSDDDIDDIVKQTILLINQINSIYSHNKIEVTRLLDKAYETIFNALLYEKVFNRQDILEYLKSKNLSTNRENLGKVLRDKVEELMRYGELSKDEVDEEFIDHIDEGLGYDYLSDEFLGTMSRKILVSKHHSVNTRKQQMSEYMTGVIEGSNDEYTSLLNKLDESKKEVSKLRKTRATIAAKTAAIILIPFLSLGIGIGAGRAASNQIDEYATITRNVNLETGAIVGEPSKVYDERETTYVATITIYEPWKKNPTGVGYIRNATAYEYIVPQDVPEDYHVTKEEVEGNLREKYRFNEPKDQLGENDSMTDAVIIVTETYQDKSDTQKSSKYVVPFALVGFFLSSILEGVLLYTKGFSLTDFHDKRFNAYIDLRNGKQERAKIKQQLLDMKSKVLSIQADKKRIEEEYGIEIGTQLLYDTEQQQLKRH